MADADIKLLVGVNLPGSYDLVDRDFASLQKHIDAKQLHIKLKIDNVDTDIANKIKTVSSGIKSADISSEINSISSAGSVTVSNLDSVSNILREICNLLGELSTALKPLTSSLNDTTTTFGRMASTSLASIDSLYERLEQLLILVNAISQKDFNINISTTGKSAANVASNLESFKSLAIALAQAQADITELSPVAARGSGQQQERAQQYIAALKQAGIDINEVIRTFLNVQSTGGGYGFSADDFIDRLVDPKKSQAAINRLNTLASVVSKLFGVLKSQFPGAVTDEFLAQLQPIEIKSDTAMVAEKLSQSLQGASEAANTINSPTAFSELKSVIEDISNRIAELKDSINSLFTFNEANPNFQAIQSICDKIYSYFEQLIEKINAGVGNMGGNTASGGTSTATPSGNTNKTTTQEATAALTQEAEAIEVVKSAAAEAARETGKLASETKTYVAGEEEASRVTETWKNAIEGTKTVITQVRNEEGELSDAVTKVTQNFEAQAKAQEKSTNQLTTARAQIADARRNVAGQMGALSGALGGGAVNSVTYNALGKLDEQYQNLFAELSRGEITIDTFNARLKNLSTTYKELADATRSYIDASKQAKVTEVSSAYRDISNYLEKNTRAKNTDQARQLEDLRVRLFRVLQESENLGGGLAAINKTELNDILGKIGILKAQIHDAGKEGKSLGDRVKWLAEKFSYWFSASQIILKLIQGLRQMIVNVHELDDAMTELKKVTDATEAEYSKFFTDATARAKELGASIKDVVNASAIFARLGFGLSESASLGDAAIVYQNVGDGINDIETASESIISTMQAFGIEADNAMSIVDKFNEVGKNHCRAA